MSEYRKLLIKKLEDLKSDAQMHNELEIASMLQSFINIFEAGNEKDLVYLISEYSKQS